MKRNFTERESVKRASIIDCALRAIAESGSFNVTMEHIAKSAGFSKGGLNHYFSSKDELFEAAFQEYFDRIFVRSQETVNSFPDPLDKLLSFDWLFNWEDADVNIGYPVLFDCHVLAVRNATYRRIFHEWVERWVDMLRIAVIEGIEKGIFPKIDPEATARCISAIYHGFATRWYLDKEGHSTKWAIEYYRKTITGLIKGMAGDSGRCV